MSFSIDYWNNGAVAVDTDSTLIRPALAAGQRRAILFITNAGATDCYISFGVDAVASKGVLLKANGGGVGFDGETLWNGTVNAIVASESTSTILTFSEGVDE